MKKVNYALGALGLAPAVLLAAVPTATASAAVHGPKKSAKAVSVLRDDHAMPSVTCGSGHHVSNLSTNGHFKNRTFYSLGGGGCVNHVIGALNKSQTGLEMRTRIIHSGIDTSLGFVHGTIASGITAFSMTVNRNAGKTCLALVNSTNHASVKYGPVCDSI